MTSLHNFFAVVYFIGMIHFISANNSDDGESRSALTADLTFVSEIPEPATMILLGLGGLLLRKRK
jgi:hypothetical protein